MKIFPFVLLIFITSCEQNLSSSSFSNVPVQYTADQFGEYWYSSKAEVASYSLQQSRYGEIRMGEAVMIFVTEPFSNKKQVKLDNPKEAGEDEVTVMKMNFTRNFLTGIYPYSMMLSVFTPIDSYHHPKTLKSALSSQEWCGQAFSQFNLKGNSYEFVGYSYFETEGDRQEKLSAAVLEDELFTRTRLNPGALPTGEFEIIASSFYNRFYHIPFSVEKATGTLTPLDSTTVYSVKYNNGKREISIEFKNDFPYIIERWEEKDISEKGESFISTGTLLKTLHTDYWSKNSSNFEYLRDSLQLKN
ncbi:MAG: hypothetical protein OEW75_14355 [Cyclobacteriaceae bacterium]|nr:hypothetical protein [Cyclobacteriaceae bacterium]